MTRKSGKGIGRTRKAAPLKKWFGKFKRNTVNVFAMLGFATVLILAGWFFFGG